jgi:acetoin utilization deacetylase AcuC-like enzyme
MPRAAGRHRRPLAGTGVGDALDRREAPEAPLADIELAHGRMHVAAMRGLSDQLRRRDRRRRPDPCQIDPDTSINVHTWAASLRAAGARWPPPTR